MDLISSTKPRFRTPCPRRTPNSTAGIAPGFQPARHRKRGEDNFHNPHLLGGFPNEGIRRRTKYCITSNPREQGKPMTSKIEVRLFLWYRHEITRLQSTPPANLTSPKPKRPAKALLSWIRRTPFQFPFLQWVVFLLSTSRHEYLAVPCLPLIQPRFWLENILVWKLRHGSHECLERLCFCLSWN